MVNSSLYNKVLSMAHKNPLFYKGVNINGGILNYYYDVFEGINTTHGLSYFRLLVHFLKMPDLRLFFQSVQENRCVFTYQNARKDYLELIDLARIGISSASVPLNVTNYGFSLKSLYCTLNLYFNIKFHSSYFRMKEKIFLFSLIYHYIFVINRLLFILDNKSVVLRKYIPFNSSYRIENIITQVLNIKGVNTYHLCHGLHFVQFKNFYPVDYLNQFNVSAQYILAWGDCFLQNNSEKYVFEVVGNPKYPYKKIRVKNSFSHCIVFLSRPIYEEGNMKLLNILAEIKAEKPILNFAVKPHPNSMNLNFIEQFCQDKKMEYLNKDVTISSILQSGRFDFSISYQTNVYFEAMYYNLPCFRYIYQENEDWGDHDDRFLEKEDLLNQIDKIRNKDREQLSKELERILVTSLGMGINRYKEVINL